MVLPKHFGNVHCDQTLPLPEENVTATPMGNHHIDLEEVESGGIEETSESHLEDLNVLSTWNYIVSYANKKQHLTSLTKCPGLPTNCRSKQVHGLSS